MYLDLLEQLVVGRGVYYSNDKAIVCKQSYGAINICNKVIYIHMPEIVWAQVQYPEGHQM